MFLAVKFTFFMNYNAPALNYAVQFKISIYEILQLLHSNTPKPPASKAILS